MFSQSSFTSTRRAAAAEAREAARAEGRAEGAAAERARIKGILESPEAAGRWDVAMKLALETDMAVEPARQFLRAAPIQPEASIPGIERREEGVATMAEGPPPAAETPIDRVWASALRAVNGSRDR